MQFVRAILPIINEHDAACRAASSSHCENCGSPSVKVLQTPMSWLHIRDRPFVNVLVNAACDKGECEMKLRQMIQSMMSELGA